MRALAAFSVRDSNVESMSLHSDAVLSKASAPLLTERRLASNANAHFREASSFFASYCLVNESIAAKVRSPRGPLASRMASRARSLARSASAATRSRVDCGTSSSSSVSGDGGTAGRGGGFRSGDRRLCGDAVLRGGDGLRCGGSAARGASARPLDRLLRSMRARSESDTSRPSVARASRSTRSGSGALRASRRSAALGLRSGTAVALGRRVGTAVALGRRSGTAAARRSRGGAGGGATGGATGSRGAGGLALPDAAAASSASRRAFLALRAAIRSASVLIA
mmetsp:Transcript_20429/g.63148  ORF Transcript_20429/g.63148 Transcript_20429/m.63148 type:complete len:282 (+) Transcript_20429:2453-3298(+)